MCLWASGSARMFSLRQWRIMNFSEALDSASRLFGGIFRLGRRLTRSWQSCSHVHFSCLHGYAKTSTSYNDAMSAQVREAIQSRVSKTARHSWDWMSAFKMSVTFSFRNDFHFHLLSAPFRFSRRRFFTYILIFGMFESLQYWIILTL